MYSYKQLKIKINEFQEQFPQKHKGAIMDKKRLTSVYNRICAFNRSEVKDKEEAKSIKAEVYEICMTEGANTDNYEGSTDWEFFGSARTIMQVVFNAVAQDVYAAERMEPEWNGFNFAETDMKRSFENNSFDKRWDWDEWSQKFEEAFRIKDIDAYIERIYKDYAERYPWLDIVQMTDNELEERLSRDIGSDEGHFLLNNGFKKPYDRICINILKSFYETGEHHLVDDNYINGQLEDVIERIKDPEFAKRCRSYEN